MSGPLPMSVPTTTSTPLSTPTPPPTQSATNGSPCEIISSPPTTTIATLVIGSFPLFSSTTNGSVVCIDKFIRTMQIDSSPWLFVSLSHLQFDLNNPRQCGAHNLHQYKNQKQAFYLSNSEDIVQVGELVQLMKNYTFHPKMRIISVDADAGYLASFLKQILSIHEWVHLCTLHLTKNAFVLQRLKLFQYDNAVEIEPDYLLEPNYYKKEKLVADRCDHYFVVSESEKMWVQNIFKRTTCNIYYPNETWWSNEASNYNIYYPDEAGWSNKWLNKVVNPQADAMKHLCASLDAKTPTCIDIIKSHHPSKHIVLLPGRITYQKGIHLVLKSKIPKNVHICIMSSTAVGDENIIKFCKNTIAQNTEHFSWIGPLFDEEKIRILSQCDAVLCPSVYEPFGLLGLETLLFSSAVLITSGVDGMQDYLTNGGYISCGPTVESVEQALFTFATMSDQQKSSIVAKGHERALTFCPVAGIQ